MRIEHYPEDETLRIVLKSTEEILYGEDLEDSGNIVGMYTEGGQLVAIEIARDASTLVDLGEVVVKMQGGQSN